MSIEFISPKKRKQTFYDLSISAQRHKRMPLSKLTEVNNV